MSYGIAQVGKDKRTWEVFDEKSRERICCGCTEDQAKMIAQTLNDKFLINRLTSALTSLILFTKPTKSNAAALANAHSVLKEIEDAR